MNTAMIQQERRSCSRKTLNPLPYISLAPDSGGLVLDVSEQGLRFRATGPLELSGPIRFSFSAHSDLVEGVADLVWTDPANKTGGLRFTEVSEDARAMIRRWPHESDLQLSVGQDFMLHMPPRDDSWRVGARLRGAFEAALRYASFRSKGFGIATRESLQSGQKEGAAILGAPRLKSLAKERKRAFLVASSVTIAVILVTTFSYLRHREVGEWLVRLGTKISGESQLQALAQTGTSTPSTQPSGTSKLADESKAASALEPVAPQTTSAAAPVISKATPSSPSPPTAPSAKARRLPSAAHGGDLVVQVAALRQEAEAREMADSLRHKNFQAFVRTLPADALYRVLLGPYANKADASAAVAELKKAGFRSFVRREPGGELSGSLRIPTP